MYFRSYTCITEHNLVLRILYLFYGAYSCTKVPVGTTHVHYTEVPVGTTGLILILQDLYLFYRYGSTRRYYRDITECILVLQNLFLYGSTRKYYLFKCPKRHTLVLISNLSYTHTGVPVGTTEFILIRSL